MMTVFLLCSKLMMKVSLEHVCTKVRYSEYTETIELVTVCNANKIFPISKVIF